MPGAYLHGFDETTGEPVMCRVTSDGKLIVNAASILENPPTEDQALKAPTSEWAYDHWKNTSAHHAKFTAVEARAAIDNILTAAGKLNGVLECEYNVLNNMAEFRVMSTADDLYYTTVKGHTSSQYLAVSAYRIGVGYVPAAIMIYDGSVYHYALHNGHWPGFFTASLQNPPIEDDANKAPTSEWAYDHWKNAAAHHAKYTDKEAVDSFKTRALTITTGTETSRNISTISMIYMNTAGGDITLEGFDGGYQGQVVFCLKTAGANQVIIDHNSVNAAAGDKILTYSGANETMIANHYGSFYMIYNSTNWFINHYLT